MEIFFDMVLRQAQYENHKKIGTHSRTFGTYETQDHALQKKNDHLSCLTDLSLIKLWSFSFSLSTF